MRFFSYCLIILLIANQCYGRDPFNKENQSVSTKPIEQSITFSCHTDVNAVANTMPFSQLHLIGTLITKAQSEALFSDQKQQIFSVKIGEYISIEKLQIKEISKQKVLLFQWKNHCEKPELITLKL